MNKGRYKSLTIIREKIESLGLTLEYNDLDKKNYIVKTLLKGLKQIPDTRMQGKVKYPAHEILFMTIIAIFTGCDTVLAIQDFGKDKQKWLRNFSKYTNIPAHDTIQRVLSLVNHKELEKVLVSLSQSCMSILEDAFQNHEPENPPVIINIDGKEARGTGRPNKKDGAIKNIRTLNIFNSNNNICLRSVLIDEKSNEIPAAQEALKEIGNLDNTILTCDALNTQKDTVTIANNVGADYVFALKLNHRTAFSEVESFFDDELKENIMSGTRDNKGELYGQFYETVDYANSCVVYRRYYLSSKIEWFEPLHQWANLKSFICCDKTVVNLNNGETESEIRYFISSLDECELAAYAIRKAWSIEIGLHWQLDVSLGDDRDRNTNKNTYMNLTQVRRFVIYFLNIMQLFEKNTSFKRLMNSISRDVSARLGSLFGFFNKYKKQELGTI